MPRAGKLRHRVSIQAPTTVPDTFGDERPPDWNEHAEVWAGYADLTGREFLTKEQEAGELTGRFWLRDRADLTTDMRVVHGLRVFDIQAIIRPEKPGGWLQLMVLERVG